jgi:hypothetical protein
MEESAYREAFPLMCEVDILDAHDYRSEVFENIGHTSIYKTFYYFNCNV